MLKVVVKDSAYITPEVCHIEIEMNDECSGIKEIYVSDETGNGVPLSYILSSIEFSVKTGKPLEPLLKPSTQEEMEALIEKLTKKVKSKKTAKPKASKCSCGKCNENGYKH